MRPSGLLLSMSLALASGTSSLSAQTLEVPSEYPNIQDAIEAAQPGDRIEVGAGTYFETIDFLGKSIAVIGLDGPESTTIDAQQQDVVVRFVNGEGPASLISGFTLQNGRPAFGPDARGGGVVCVDSSPSIVGNVITSNQGYWWGAGVYSSGGSPFIVENDVRSNEFLCGSPAIQCGLGAGVFCENGSATILRNHIFYNLTPWRGGGVYCRGPGTPLIASNVIDFNIASDGGGLAVEDGSNPLILNNLFDGNEAVGFLAPGGPALGEGGGILIRNATATLRNCTILDNRARDPFSNLIGNGGGIALDTALTPTVESSIIFTNIAGDGPSIYTAPGTVVTVTYSDVEGGFAGIGNFDADPILVLGPLGFFYLGHVAAGDDADSPCIDAGEPGLPLIPGSTRSDGVPDSGVVDLGFHFELASPSFRRGDADGDGNVNGLVDGLFLLGYQFVAGSPAPPCLDAADVDDSGTVNGLVDGLFILAFQFIVGSPPPPLPGPVCGEDLTLDGLPCVQTACSP